MCPICRFEHVDKDMQQCPQCDADLTCFRVLDALPIEAAHSGQSPNDLSPPLEHGGQRQIAAAVTEPILAQAPPSRPSSGGRWIAWAVGLCVGALIAFGAVWTGLPVPGLFPAAAIEKQAPDRQVANALAQISARLDSQYQQHDKILAELARTIDKTEQKLVSLESMIKNMPIAQPAADEAQTVDTVAVETETEIDAPVAPLPSNPYTILQGDSLWRISERFYGNGSYYPILLSHNPGLSIQNIRPGFTIMIPGDAAWAKALYPTITQRAGGRLYLLYTVQPGDTPSTLAARFCPYPRDGSNPLICLEPETIVAPGRTVRIRLE